MEENRKALGLRRIFTGNLKENALNKVPVKDRFKITESLALECRNEEQPFRETHSDKVYDDNLNINLYCEETIESDNEIQNNSPENSVVLDPYAEYDNSLDDIDYVPDLQDLNNDSDETICESPVQKYNVIIDEKFIKYQKNKKYELNFSEQNEQLQYCEYRNCNEKVFSTCAQCQSLLCWDHFKNEFFYNDCKNHVSKSFENLINDSIFPNTNTEKQTTPSINSFIESDNLVQECGYTNCNQNVQSTCDKCLCYLCLDHFNSQDCENHETVLKKCEPNYKKKINNKIFREDVGNKAKIDIKKMPDQHCEFINCTKEVCSSCEKCSCLLCIEHYFLDKNTIICVDNHKPYTSGSMSYVPILTKDGYFRKRKFIEESKESRKYKRDELKKEKTYLRRSCEVSCKKKCVSKFSHEQRRKIHEEYNNLNYETKGLYIKRLVDMKSVQTRKQNTSNSKRNATYVYNFISNENEKIAVCKTFFLCTLGYDPKNDYRVMAAIKKPVQDQKDKRGRYIRESKIDRHLIQQHIMKYEPSVSHYRRQHAPNRLYLASDINIGIMFKDFCLQHPDIKISAETYRKVVKNELNISFAHLGHEECEQCTIYKEHNKNQNCNDECEVCCEHKLHKAKYTIARQQYKKDVEKATSRSDTKYCSVDLQKVVMLPRIDQFKSAIFCPRIVAYNESFVPLGSAGKNVPYAVLWHEAISGRSQDDIISAFRAYFINNRDVAHFVLWMDN